MTPAEVSKLLGKCAAFDSRTVGEADVLAWHEVLAHLPLSDALAAVTVHYSTETRRIMPADVRAVVKKIRAERVVHPDAIPDADPDRPLEYIQAIREDRMVIASGGTVEIPSLTNVTRRVS